MRHHPGGVPRSRVTGGDRGPQGGGGWHPQAGGPPPLRGFTVPRTEYGIGGEQCRHQPTHILGVGCHVDRVHVSAGYCPDTDPLPW